MNLFAICFGLQLYKKLTESLPSRAYSPVGEQSVEQVETRVGAKGRLPKDGPLWHEDYFELKSNQNPADSVKFFFTSPMPKKNLDRGPAPGRVITIDSYIIP